MHSLHASAYERQRLEWHQQQRLHACHGQKAHKFLSLGTLQYENLLEHVGITRMLYHPLH
jgi:hypothetical protein